MSISMAFNSIVEQIVSASFSSSISQERRNDIAKIGKAWDFYYGEQEKYIKQYRGESDLDYKDKDKMIFNYTKSIVDEYINGVFAKPVIVDFAEEKYQQVWNSIVDPLSFFNILPFMVKCQRIAEISNTCVVMIRYNKEKQQVYFEDIRGEFVTFIPDKENPKKIGAIIISYLYDTGDTDPQKRFMKRIEIWDKEKWEIWLHNDTLKEKKMHSKGKNPYGFIPAVRFVPEEDDNTFYGISSINDIVKVNEVYNNLWTSLVRTSIMQSFSVLVMTTDGELDVTVAPTRFLKFENSDKAEAKYITPDPKINDVEKVLKNLREELQDFSKVPKSVIAAQSTLAPESGYALRVKRMPIEQLWQQRRMSYGPSFELLTKYSIIVDKINKKEDVNNNEDIDVNIEFSTVAPPLSPNEQIVQDQHDLRYNIITPVDMMMRRFPNMTREQAIKKINENAKEIDSIQLSEFSFDEDENNNSDDVKKMFSDKEEDKTENKEEEENESEK